MDKQGKLPRWYIRNMLREDQHIKKMSVTSKYHLSKYSKKVRESVVKYLVQGYCPYIKGERAELYQMLCEAFRIPGAKVCFKRKRYVYAYGKKATYTSVQLLPRVEPRLVHSKNLDELAVADDVAARLENKQKASCVNMMAYQQTISLFHVSGRSKMLLEGLKEAVSLNTGAVDRMNMVIEALQKESVITLTEEDEQ